MEIFALHVECDKDSWPRVRVIIGETYCSKAKVFPGNWKFRIVSPRYTLTNLGSKAKWDHLRIRQGIFVANALDMLTTEIKSLDRPLLDVYGERFTVRQRLMNVKSEINPHLTLFLGVDHHFRDEGTVISFLQQNNAEARNFIAGMVPIFQYHCGEEAEKVFDPFAWRRHKDSEWDPVTKEVTTAIDREICLLDEQDPEMCGVSVDPASIRSILSPPGMSRKLDTELQKAINEDLKLRQTGSGTAGTSVDLVSTMRSFVEALTKGAPRDGSGKHVIPSTSASFLPTYHPLPKDTYVSNPNETDTNTTPPATGHSAFSDTSMKMTIESQMTSRIEALEGSVMTMTRPQEETNQLLKQMLKMNTVNPEPMLDSPRFNMGDEAATGSDKDSGGGGGL